MNSIVTIIKTVPALLPATLAVFLLLPVSAENPSSAGLPVAAQVPLAAQMAVAAVAPVSTAVPVSAQPSDDDYDYQSTDKREADVVYDEPTVEIVILTPNQLADLVGPIALYPDDLLAIALPASTYPMEIAEAARFLENHKADPTLQPNEDWDESVTALLNYPEVLRMMYDDIEWTWELGGAVLNQQPDVIEAVESFRDRAYAAGNLRSDDYQTVSNDGGAIEITPVNEEVIYVPYYEPRRVVVRQIEPVYYYYPRPRPVYYYPYSAGHSFLNGYFWGVTTAYGIGWSNHRLSVRHHSFWSHPYYGRSYYGSYYRQPSVNIYNTWYVNNSGYHSNHRYRDGDRWRPRPNSNSRPGNRPGNRPPVPSHDRDGRDTIAINPGVLASQPSNVARPGTVNRLRDRNVDLSTRREDPNLRRDRDINARGSDRDRRPAIAGHTANVPVTTQRPRDDSPRRPTDNNRFQDRPNTATDTTRKPSDRIRFRDRPAATTADTRQPSGVTRFRDRPDAATDTTRKPSEPIRFRDRPAATTADTRQPSGVTRFRDRPDATTDTTRKPRDPIRFRERPDTPAVAMRPDANRASSTNRQQTLRTVSSKPLPARDRAPARPVAAVREPATRASNQARFRSQRPVAAPPQQRQPARVQPQVQRERQTERSAPRSKPRAASQPNRAEQTRKAPAREGKASRAKTQKAKSTSKRSKQRK